MIVAAVLLAVLIWYFAIRSLPDYNASYEMAGLSAPVEIVRSTENVPHIFSETDEDAFFALGVAHAQDRLFQMTTLRRAAQGRLSEIYGVTTFAQDDVARRLGLYRHAKASLDVQDPKTLSSLRAYSAGVNEWIREVNENAMGRGAPEFFLYPSQISYWQPADSIAILKLYAASASQSAMDEVLRARLSLAWPEHGIELMSPDAVALPAYGTLFPGGRLGAPDPDRTRKIQDLRGFMRPGLGMGGNSFAAAGTHTAASGALLASDPQTALTAPSLFYLARLELQSGGVIGATIPGIPAILSGRGADLAWGITPAHVDDADLYIEEIKPGSNNSYRGREGWMEFKTDAEVIRVLDAPAQTITLRETENGPLVPGIAAGLRDVTPSGYVPALRWTGLSDEDTTMSALVGLMHSGNRQEAEAAMAGVVAPVLSVTLADGEGIAKLTAGAMPERAADNPTEGKLPAPGWIHASNWTRIRNIVERHDVNEKDSSVVLATDEPDSGLRRARLNYLLSDRDVHSRDSFISAQLDVVSPTARALLPLVGANLWFTGEPAAAGTPERQRQDALSLLAEWDGEMNEHLPEPLIYAAWMRELQNRLIRDEIGPLADDIDRLYPEFIKAVFRNQNGADRWCDVIQSAPKEDCTTIARQALDRAILDLTDRSGPNVTSWRWGDVHQAQQDHPALGGISGLGWIMNLTQSISGGDFTVAKSGLLGHGETPYEAVSGAAYRGVYDLSDPDSSVFVISTGQSGHPFSRHYDDLAGLWRRGEYIGMSLDPELARAASVGITKLVPSQ